MAIDGGRSTAAYSRFAEEMDIDSDAVEVNTHGGGYYEGKMGTLKTCFMTRWKLWAVIALCMLSFLFGFLLTHIIVSPCIVGEGTPAPTTMPSSNTSTEHHEGDGRKYAEKIAGYIKVEHFKSYIEQFTEHNGSFIHDSGSSASIQNANEIKKTWKAYGFQVTLKKYSVTLTRPDKSQKSKLQIKQNGNVSREIVPGDASTGNVNLLPPFSVGSLSIDEENVNPTFVNYGKPEDFFTLADAGRDVNGKVCVFKLGKVQTPILVQRCADYGGVGVIAFPDPADYVFESAYPEGRGLPPKAVIRDFASPLFGDPSTPSLPSINGVAEGNIYNITQLPTLIISYSDASILLSQLSNPAAPEKWRGGLQTGDQPSYYVGGEGLQHGTLRMIVANENKQQTITNVFGTIKGSVEPDRYVIFGCHRDSLTAGAVEPGTGMAVFMELSRLVNQLITDGWTPRRTLIFASWDGGDDGHIGSTEWVEENKEILNQRAVAYINLDEAVAGNTSFAAEGSAIFAKALRNATQQVDTPDSTSNEGSVFDTWQKMNPEVGGENYYQLEPLGIYTDATPFLHIAGVPSVDLKYTYDKSGKYIPRYPLWHTSFDTVDYVETQVDRNWNVHKTMTDIAGYLLLMYASDIVLPVDVNDYASTIATYVEQLKAKNGSDRLDMAPLDAAVNKLKAAAKKFHENFILQLDIQDDMKVREANDRLVAMERAFLSPNGQTHMYPQLRHMIYGPSSEGAYEGEGLAPLSYAISVAHGMQSVEKWDIVEKVLAATVVAINKAANALVVDKLFT